MGWFNNWHKAWELTWWYIPGSAISVAVLKRRTAGGTWEVCSIKVYNAGVFVNKPLKLWTGTEWITVTQG